MSNISKLFQPIRLGHTELGHRVVMAPLTRFRANYHVPLPIVKEYYLQRCSTPGTLIISEATGISPGAGAYRNSPGIWSTEQITAWKEITDAIHAKGCKIYCQLWHLGRSGQADTLAMFGRRLKAPSAIKIESDFAKFEVPEELTEQEIWEIICDYGLAARNAVERAGFDGVEIHGANGYLPDQFLQDVSNKRCDQWGGSIENRSRFHLEVTKAVIDAVGGHRTGIRLSPHSQFLSMGMQDPMPQFAHLVGKLKGMGLAYLHLVEWRISGHSDTEVRPGRTNDPLTAIWDNVSPVILAGAFSPTSAIDAVDTLYKDLNVLVAFGRHFIANPDLVYRIKTGAELNKYDRSTFYLPISEKGYIDYPFVQEALGDKARD
ncbi:hypothetical protein V8F20_003232 [Naviculisporaceae sp. PSN 640]